MTGALVQTTAHRGRVCRRAVVRFLWLLALSALVPSITRGDWLVTKDGHLLKTEGPWQVDGDRVVFNQPWAKTLVSLPATEVDLDLSMALTRVASGQTLESDRSNLPIQIETAPRTHVATVSEERRRLIEDIDDERPDQQQSVLVFGRPLTIGGSLAVGTSFESGHQLDREALDEEVDQRRAFTLEFLYAPSKTVTLFAEADLSSREVLYQEAGEERASVSGVRRGRTWLHWAPGDGGASLQLGRQSFQEPRQWWWNRKLDAGRLRYRGKRVKLDLAVAQELAPVDLSEDRLDAEDEDVLRVLGWISWRYAKRHHFDVFFLDQMDRSPTELLGDRVEESREDDRDADLRWLGLRARGTRRLGRAGAVSYWLDGALVRGEETFIDFDDAEPGFRFADRIDVRSVEGWAVDAAFTWSTRLPGSPAVSLGYARGSGDDDLEERTDASFRQTGLQRNKQKFGGVESYRLYGEILDPELSNLEVGTLAIGFPLLRSSSIDLAAHFYRQILASPFLRGDRLAVSPGGERRDLGAAIDLVFALEEWEHWRLRLIGSAFRAGPAYEVLEGEMVYETDFKISLVF